MVNRWIDEEWAGPNGAHAALLDTGLADVCAFVPKLGARVEGCQGYVSFDAMKAAQLGVELTKDQALVQLLFKTSAGATISPAPKNGDALEFDDRTLEIASRIKSDDDSWYFQCKV